MDTKKLALVSLVQMPGYAVLLQYFTEGCKNLEIDMLNTPPADEKAVLAAHREAVGAWKLFKEVTARISRDVGEMLPKPELTEKELEELHLSHL